MDVGVEHALPRSLAGIEHEAEARLVCLRGQAQFASHRGCVVHQLARGLMIGAEFADIRAVLQRYDEHMNWRLRINVAKGQ